ncbi:6-carboxytetrahydropterin synthase QueD [bacterium]|nr:6-carboxytetrahydropterin synthase QueD [bacterium]
MFEVVKEISISSTHRIREHKGGCENIHGHNWKIRVYVKAEQLDELGMVVDFKVLKNKMNQIIMPLDHTDINEHPYFQDNNPTSENLAKYIFDELSKEINDSRVSVSKVVVFETDTSRAIYSI